MDIVQLTRGLIAPALLASFFLWASPTAYAQTGCASADSCDQGEAYALALQAGYVCVSAAQGQGTPLITGPLPWSASHDYYLTRRSYNGDTYLCSSSIPQAQFMFLKEQTCDTRETQNGGWHVDQDPETSDDVCNDGCYMEYSFDITPGLPSPNVWTPSGATCDVAESAPPDPDTDEDGTPDDEDAFPEDPEETEDTDGDGQGDNGDFAPEDETNGADDGEGNEADNQSAGGGSCSAPPTCSGDGIQCNQLFQLWHIRCTGDAGDDGDDDFDSPPTSGDETAQEGDTEVLTDKEIGPDLLDDSGWLSRSCPAIPTFSLGSLGTYTPDITGWCELIETIGGLIMLLAALIALRILVA